jgi:2-polyprenyl-3-methyl-5-hydroxy-6-metoxy-1,4-benzoquinol methylase
MTTENAVQTDSIERIIPDHVAGSEATGSETLELHLERYRFAAENLLPGRILDIACGAGYGSVLLADAPGTVSVTGVDADESAITYARERYAHAKVTFQTGDAYTYSAAQKFDSIVTLETIEHLPDPGRFVAHLATLVRSKGRVIASTPVTPSVDANPFHLHDFTPRSFRRLFLSLGFREIASRDQVQRFSAISILLRREKRAESIRRGLLGYYLRNPSSLGKRILSTATNGFANRYSTIVWEAP